MGKKDRIKAQLQLQYEEELLYKEELKNSFYFFFKEAWPIIEGTVEFYDNWHIQALCDHLEAAYNGEIKKLLINVPPRSSKSSIISIAFPAWVWINRPSSRFLYSSYSKELSMEHSLKCRRLIESEWYENLFRNIFKISVDQNTKSFFDNDKKGCRISTSVGGTTTGKGGDFLIADDPNNVRDGESEVKRLDVLSWFNSVWPSRMNSPKTGVQIVVQQRVHERDVSGEILATDYNDEWVKLILPMEFEPARKAVTCYLEKYQEVWEDPRVQDKELLCGDRFDENYISTLKTRLGSYGYAGQYQQRPAPEDGGIIKKEWFKKWDEEDSPDVQFIIQSWDTALTANKDSAYSACSTWGVFLDNNGLENIILLSMWRKKVEYPELRDRAKRLFYNYIDINESKPDIKAGEVDLCLIEAKASGDPLIQDLTRAGLTTYPFNPSKYGDKMRRVRLVTPLIENGRVWLPLYSGSSKFINYAEEFVENVSLFPNAESRDLVDSFTQTLLYLKDNFDLHHSSDQIEEEETHLEKVDRLY